MKTQKIVWRGAVGKKVLSLIEWLQGQGSVAIGFSGGVDSTFLAAVAQLALGKKALAVTIDTPLLARSELREARVLAKQIGIRLRVERINVLTEQNIAGNPPDRCYYCKKIDFTRIREVAKAAGIACVCDGSNVEYVPRAMVLAQTITNSV